MDVDGLGIDADRVVGMVAEQVAGIVDPAWRREVEARLVEPRCELLDWDYGAAGQQYPCWVVAEFPEVDVALVYSEHGFAPEAAWGGVFLSERCMGMDCQWYPNLEQAYRAMARSTPG